MSNKNKVIKNFTYNILYEMLRLLAPLITTPYISRVLGATGVGEYSYAHSIATYFVLVGAVGTTLYGQREIAYVQNNPKKRTDTFWEIEIFRGTTAIICTVLFYIIFGNDPNYSILYQILSLEVLATAFDISWFYMGMENFKLIVTRNSIIKIVSICLVFLFVKKAEDVPLYTLCVTAPILLGNLSLWFRIKKYIGKPDRDCIKNIPKRILPIFLLFIPQIAIEVYAVLDKTMLGILGSGMEQVGYYTQAQKIVKIVLTIIISLGTVMLPAMSVAFAEGKKEEMKRSIMTAFRFVFMLSSALLFGVLAVSKQFVPLFFGAGYEDVILLINVISPILVIIGVSNVIGKQYLLPTKQQKAFTISVVMGAVVNFCLNIVFIRRWDAIGASVATVFAELAVTVVQMWFVRKQLHLKELIVPFLKYLGLGLVMFCSVRGVGNLLSNDIYALIIMIFVGILVYLTELVVCKDEFFKYVTWKICKKGDT